MGRLGDRVGLDRLAPVLQGNKQLAHDHANGTAKNRFTHAFMFMPFERMGAVRLVFASEQAQEETMSLYAGKLDKFIRAVHFRHDPVILVSAIAAGDKVGLYRALADNPTSPAELANATGIDVRCVCEWLANHAASGYIQYDATSQRFWMTEQQAHALADQAGHDFMKGAFVIWRHARLHPR